MYKVFTAIGGSNGFLEYRIWALDTGAYVCHCRFDVSRYDASLYQLLGVYLPDSIKRSVVKRQAEFLSGRFAAAKVLNMLDMPAVDVEIGAHRSPVWPEGITASISHSNSNAICVASITQRCKFVGVDIERWLSPRSARQISNLVVDSFEKFYFDSLTISFEQCITIAFSAKESLYKALYPSVKRYLDFDVARIKSICLEDGVVALVITKDLSEDIKQGMEYSCRIQTDQLGVLTLIA